MSFIVGCLQICINPLGSEINVNTLHRLRSFLLIINVGCCRRRRFMWAARLNINVITISLNIQMDRNLQTIFGSPRDIAVLFKGEEGSRKSGAKKERFRRTKRISSEVAELKR